MYSHFETIFFGHFGLQGCLKQCGYTFSNKGIASGMITISENVTLLSSEMICGTIVISKSSIRVIRDFHFFTSDLCHKHDQCKCQRIARKVGYFRVVIRNSYLPFSRKPSSENPQNLQN